MSRVAAFGRFWFDFVVGDDWRAAVGIVAAIVATYLLAHDDVNAWWLIPVAVAVILGLSLRRAARASERPD